MSGFLELVGNRCSVRKFQQRPIEREKIDLCVEAARLAPSAENVQPWRFVIIDERDKIEEFCEAAFGGIYRFSRFASGAAAIAVIAARPDVFANKLGTRVQGTQYYLIDVGIAGEHFVLQAAEQGIGTCWIGWFNEKKARRYLKLARGHRVAALIAMGYSDQERKRPRPRKTLDEIRYYIGSS